MAVKHKGIKRILRQLRNNRDLRAEVLQLATMLLDRDDKTTVKLEVIQPAISEATVRAEWDRMLLALVPEVRDRMTLVIDDEGGVPSRSSPSARPPSVLIARPNYRFEVLRLLLVAAITNDGPRTAKTLVEQVGASQTPIGDALAAFSQAGILESWGHGKGFSVVAEEVSLDVLAKLEALPQTLKFRFEPGGQIKPPVKLLERAVPLLRPLSSPAGWSNVALSGVQAAMMGMPSLDLLGLPRLDLVMQWPRDERQFDAALLRLLDDGLEPEPNPLASAPVVVTLVRSLEHSLFMGRNKIRLAHPADVFLSLLDLGMREQAAQYLRRMRR